MTEIINDTFGNSTEAYEEHDVTTYLWLVIGFLIITVGTIGHALSLAVLFSSKSMRLQSSTVYLIAMSITGLLSIYSGLLRYVIYIGFQNWETDPIREVHPIFCKFHMSITYASLQYFAWLQATIAIDRLSSVLFPHKYMTRCKWLTGLVVVLAELVAVIVLNKVSIYHFLRVDLDDEGVCTPDNDYWYEIWGYVDLVSYSILPATILIICNSAILILLNRSRMKTGSNNSAARSLTVMLMTLNLLFLVTTLPISVLFFCPVPKFNTQAYKVYDVIWTIFSLFQYTGSACTFFVYCVTGSKFREELRKLICVRALKKDLRTRNTSVVRDTTMTSARPSVSNYKSLKVSIDEHTVETSMEL